MGAPGPRAALAGQLAEVGGRLPDAGSLASVGAGIAGYESAAAEEKDEVSRALRMALPRARVRVASDARTAHLGAFRGEPGALLLGLEATGCLWEPLYEDLTRAGYTVLVLNPRQTVAWAAGLGLRAKTDGIDAHTVARGLLAG